MNIGSPPPEAPFRPVTHVRKPATEMALPRGVGEIRVGWIFLALVAIELTIVAVNFLDWRFGMPSRLVHDLFYVDGEANIPTWFSSSQLLVAGSVVGLAAFAGQPERNPSRLFFLVVAVCFVFLSMDEVATVHEQIGGRLKKLAFVPRFADSHGGWIVLYALIAAALLVVNWRNLLACWTRHRRAAVTLGLGASLISAGAIGVEIASFGLTRDPHSLDYLLAVSVEEFLEMIGGTVLLCGALLLLREKLTPARLH